MTGTVAETRLEATMAALDSALVSAPLTERPDWIKAGVDLGTAYTVLVALDGNDRPLAAAFEYADVVRDGAATDFVGAIDVVRRLKRDVESRLGVSIPAAQGAYPPGVPRSEVRAVRHVIEAADTECSGLVDEPTRRTRFCSCETGSSSTSGEGRRESRWFRTARSCTPLTKPLVEPTSRSSSPERSVSRSTRPRS